MQWIRRVAGDSFRVELVQQLYQEMRGFHVLGAGAVGLVLVFFSGIVSLTMLATWAGLMACGLAALGWQARRFGHVLPAAQAPAWMRNYLFTYVLVCAGWALIASVLIPPLDAWQELSVFLLLFLTVTTPMTALSAYWPLAIAAATVTMLPPWLVLVVERDGPTNDVYFSLLVLVAVAVVIAKTYHISRGRIDAVDARHDLARANSEILALRGSDQVSGAVSLSAFLEVLEQLRGAGARDLAVLAVDLGAMEDVTVAEGRTRAHEVLRTVADGLQLADPLVRCVARDTGDHFLVIAEPVEAKAAEQLADRLRTAVSRLALPSGATQLEAAIGYALNEHADGLSGLELVDRALFAAADARALNSNRSSAFDNQKREQVRRRVSLRTELAGALARDELALHLQPKINLVDNRVTGAEALLRWNSRTYGNVSPMEFIPLAESTGLIVEIGEWVIEEAARIARRHRQDTSFRIAVNVSVKQFESPNLLRVLGCAAAALQATSSRLEIEVTESVVMNGPQRVAAWLEKARAMGVSLALDDFGTGYSSLGYLSSLRFDVLKLDRSFIAQIDRNSRQRELVKAVIGLAHALRMDLVAEGVETKQHSDWLREAGCAGAQGYLFSRPLPEPAFFEWLQREGRAVA